MTTYSNDRPSFIERLAKLAGGPTYRTPAAGKTNEPAPLPDAHAIAAALSFARRGPDDIGPDVAYCWVLQRDDYRHKVARKLEDALRCHQFRSVHMHRLTAAYAAWDALISGEIAPRPAGAKPIYDTMLLVACKVLHDAAWDTLAEAERRYIREVA